jgi:hypothetical protein
MPLPPRRWYQFKLSTWFVLVAIMAWAVALRPVYLFESGGGAAPFAPRHTKLLLIHVYYGSSGGHFCQVAFYVPRLLWILVPLVAFVGWKAAWAAGRRVARKALP